MEPGETAEGGPTFERTLRCSRVELGKQCFRDSVFFPLLQVTSGLFFFLPVSDRVSSWRGAHRGPVVWVILKLMEGGTLTGELGRKGFWEGGTEERIGLSCRHARHVVTSTFRSLGHPSAPLAVVCGRSGGGLSSLLF